MDDLEHGVELVRDVLQAPLPLAMVHLVQRYDAAIVLKLHNDSPSGAALTRVLFQKKSRDAGEIIRFATPAKKVPALQLQPRRVHVNQATALFKRQDGDKHADGKTDQGAKALMREQSYLASGAFPQGRSKRQSQRKCDNGSFPETKTQFPMAAINFLKAHGHVHE